MSTRGMGEQAVGRDNTVNSLKFYKVGLLS